MGNGGLAAEGPYDYAGLAFTDFCGDRATALAVSVFRMYIIYTPPRNANIFYGEKMAVKKRGPGRPKLKNPATERVEVVCRPAQKKAWLRAAKAQKMSLGGWLKEAAAAAIPRQK